jgi:protein ImuA
VPHPGKAAVLADLRRRIAGPATISAPGSAGGVTTGLPGAEMVAGGCLHEVVAGPAGAGAALAFASLLLARLAAPEGQAAPVLWCQRLDDVHERGALYGPGLAAFGLDPGQLIVARGRRDDEVLWAMEEGLRVPALAAVLGEVEALDFTSSRRLQLAAGASGVTALVLRQDGELGSTAAATRWRLAPLAGAALKNSIGDEVSRRSRWHLELLRCRGGAPADWQVEWHDETGDLAVAAELQQRPDRAPEEALVNNRAPEEALANEQAPAPALAVAS